MGRQRDSDRAQSTDPRLTQAYLDNIGTARSLADNLPEQQFAGFTPAFDQGADFLTGRAGAGQQVLQPGIQAAMAGTQFSPQQIQAANAMGMGYNPAMTGGFERIQGRGFDPATGNAAQAMRSDVRDVSGGSFMDANIGQYMNPYQSEVIDRTLGDLDRARMMQQQQTGDAAARAGAFGGSRQGVLEAETNRAFFDRAGNVAAGLRAQGFDTAAGLAGQDLGRGLQAQLANQGIDQSLTGMNLQAQQQMDLANLAAMNQAGQFGASAQNQAMLANQAAGMQMSLADQAAMNQAGQFGASAQNQAALANQQAMMQAQMANQQAGLQGAGMNLQAAGLLGNLGGQLQGMNQADASALMNLGLTQQQFQQQQLDAPLQRMLMQQDLRNQALGIVPGGTGGMGAAADRTGQIIGAVGAVGGGLASSSDRRLKENIVKVGVDENTGLNLYDFNYIGESKRYRGVMADEVESAGYAAAVALGEDGYKRVYYDALGLQMQEVA